jgi:hypothetical protein
MDMGKFLDERGVSDIQIDNINDINRVTGIEVTSLKSYRRAMETVFKKYGKTAIAVKTQHAYNRTLAWKLRTDSEAEAVLQKLLRKRTLTLEEHIRMFRY